MNSIKEILKAVAAGKVSVADAEQIIKSRAAISIGGFAVLDHDRAHRSGIPEVIYAQTKSPEQIVEIVKGMLHSNGFALITRANHKILKVLEKEFRNYRIESDGSKNHITILIQSDAWAPPEKSGLIAILTAGTSDVPYAKEVEFIAKVTGVETIKFYDIGVAGIHRLVDPISEIIERDVDAVIVLAGMEGALPTIVASLIDIPVIGLPIPVGYGFGGEGQTALASMLQSCAPGLAVVNIGNGLGAGAFACLIAKKRSGTKD